MNTIIYSLDLGEKKIGLVCFRYISRKLYLIWYKTLISKHFYSLEHMLQPDSHILCEAQYLDQKGKHNMTNYLYDVCGLKQVCWNNYPSSKWASIHCLETAYVDGNMSTHVLAAIYSAHRSLHYLDLNEEEQ